MKIELSFIATLEIHKLETDLYQCKNGMRKGCNNIFAHLSFSTLYNKSRNLTSLPKSRCQQMSSKLFME